MTPEEKWCETNFETTHYRDAAGRYVTTLSLKPNDSALGQSYQAAAQRFAALERRLQRDPELAEKYIGFMREYEALGHMTKAAPLPRADH